ncbi:MAG TPA: hypothetical protein VFL47_04795 [Flavisolibacter sp.]|nr:hypothetical protein [Flavisolibacter sp.]
MFGKFVDGDEGAFGFAEFAADAGKQFAGGVAAHAGDVGDVLWVDDDAVGMCCHGVQLFGLAVVPAHQALEQV